MIKNVHYNYIIIGNNDKPYTLLNEENLKFIYQAFSSLAAYTDIRKAKISTIQYARDPEKIDRKSRVKIGRVKWIESDLAALFSKYKAYPQDDFNSLYLSVEFPSVESAYKKQTTSEIMLNIENDNCWGKMISNGECGLLLSVREDIFDKMGEKIVLEFLKNITSLLNEYTIIFKKRRFFDVDNTESMMDASASRYRDPLYKKKYRDWEILDIR